MGDPKPSLVVTENGRSPMIPVGTRDAAGDLCGQARGHRMTESFLTKTKRKPSGRHTHQPVEGG